MQDGCIWWNVHHFASAYCSDSALPISKGSYELEVLVGGKDGINGFVEGNIEWVCLFKVTHRLVDHSPVDAIADVTHEAKLRVTRVQWYLPLVVWRCAGD